VRGLQVELPAKATAILQDLQTQRDLALDGARALQARMNMLPDDAAELRGRLTAEQTKLQEKFQTLARVFSNCNQFVMQLKLPPGSALIEHPNLNLTIKGSLVRAAEATRTRISEVESEIARLKALPLKRDSQLEAITARLASLSWAQPRIAFDARGNATVRFYEDIATMDQVLALMVYVMGPEQVAAAFARNLPEAGEDAISPEDREREIGKLSTTLLKLERELEVIISCAHADGTEILRRPTANPLAILRLAIVAAEEAAAAAA
jgi:hypothetical protein